MPAVSTVLVVGAGTAGTTTAICLARAGIAVDLVEVRSEVTAVGSGITLHGNALRVLKQAGVLDAVIAAGYPFDKFEMRAPDGTVLNSLPEARTGGPDVPAVLGIYRPDLAHILVAGARQAGARIRFGTACASLTPAAHGVEVTFTDGQAGHYDLVVGADGARSSVRGLLGCPGPRPTGLDVWRAYGPRPAGLTHTELIAGGPACAAGCVPISADYMYAFLVLPAAGDAGTPAERLARFRELASAYHGTWDDIRAGLADPGAVNWTRVESQILDPPWNRGRAVLIGDAAHTCPPTMAQGAAMALEDAAVLSEQLITRAAVDDDLWQAFTERRYPRAKWVIESSEQICRWLLAHEARKVADGAVELNRQLNDLVSVPA